MKIFPIILLTAAAIAHSPGARAQEAPSPAPQAVEALSLTMVNNLTDAECIAITHFMQRADDTTLNTWSSEQPGGESSKASEAARLIAQLPCEGLPDDFRRYIEEYCALVQKAMEKHTQLQKEITESSGDATHDLLNALHNTEKQLRQDLLALSARYSRASILGTGWERNAYERARTDLRLQQGSARAFIEANPLPKKMKPDSSRRISAYLQYLLHLPRPELTAAEARRHLERMEILKNLDPTWQLENSLQFYGINEGASYAIRLPLEASTGCSWKLAETPSEGALFSVEWQRVATESLRVNKPHGSARAVCPLPSTPETMVATLQLKKAGTAVLRFLCIREGVEAPVAEKTVTFYIRRSDDYRPLMETEPLPEPPPAAPRYEPGIASLSDEECLSIYRYLQQAYCKAMESAAQSVEKKENVQLNSVAAFALSMKIDKLPQDFHDYLIEFHNLTIRHRAKVRTLERKEYDLRHGKGITPEQRKALSKEYRELEKQEEEMEKSLKEKYPRAIILANASVQDAIRQVFRSYNSADSVLKSFYAENPDMKDASRTLSLSAYFRHLGAARAGQEQTVTAARRALERLDALRIMQAKASFDPQRTLYGEARENVQALLFPSAPSTGFSWHLESPLPADSPVEVEWKQIPSARLLKLEEMGVLHGDIPRSEELSVAIIRLKKAGRVQLRFFCTRPGDEEPLLKGSAEIHIRANGDDEN